MKILLLNQTFYPDVVATGQYLSVVAQELAQRGHEVTVVTGRRAYDNSSVLFSKSESWQGVQIYRVASTSFGKGAKWRRAVDFGSFMVACCLRLVTLPRQDLVLALTTPPLISFIGSLIAWFWRARFCYWVMDFNPDEAIAAGWLRPNSPAARVLDWLSRFSLNRADRIIALDRFMGDRIVAKGIDPGKIEVIPPWAYDDEIQFDAVGRETFRSRHGIGDRYVVMYSGNHSPVHPLDTLIAAARQLKNDPTILFYFVGGGSEQRKVAEIARDEHLQQVICLPYQPLDQLAGSLSAGDLQVVVMGDAMLGLVHPCKVYNILSIGGPLLYIGPVPSHVTELEADEAVIYKAGHGEVERVVELIREASKLTEVRRSALPISFGTEEVLPRLIKVLES